jgi:hypothetical protein
LKKIIREVKSITMSVLITLKARFEKWWPLRVPRKEEGFIVEED